MEIDVTVHDGDVFVIPRGYHGPSVAAPGYPLYYLNVLAGPGGERSMAFCDDPTHHWIRESWADDARRSPLPDDVGERAGDAVTVGSLQRAIWAGIVSNSRQFPPRTRNGRNPAQNASRERESYS